MVISWSYFQELLDIASLPQLIIKISNFTRNKRNHNFEEYLHVIGVTARDYNEIIFIPSKICWQRDNLKRCGFMTSQLTNTCSDLTIETLVKCEKYIES